MTKFSFLLAVASTMGLSALAFPQQRPFAEFIGKPVPDFTMTAIDGTKLTPKSMMGKPYIIDFWATWCSPCKQASPMLNQLQTQHKSKGLVVIGANVQDGDRANSKSVSVAYQKEHKYGYTFTYDNDKFFQKFKARGIPFFVFVDRKGVVRDIQVGFGEKQSPKIFANSLKKIL